MCIITAGLEYLRSACKVSVGGGGGGGAERLYLTNVKRFVKLRKGHLSRIQGICHP